VQVSNNHSSIAEVDENMSEEAQKKAMKRKRKLMEQMAQERYLLELKELSRQKVISYEEAFGKIEEATGISNIDQLVDTFIQAEERNFKFFKFVNQQSDEIEVLEGQIQAIQGEIDMLRDASDMHQLDV
jgi:hypothetical protein